MHQSQARPTIKKIYPPISYVQAQKNIKPAAALWQFYLLPSWIYTALQQGNQGISEENRDGIDSDGKFMRGLSVL